MTILNPIGRVRTQSAEPAIGPLLVLTGAIAAVVAVAALFRPAMAGDALLPGVSLLFLLLAGAVAVTAWQRPMQPRQFSYWDAAGVLAFIGICLGAAVEPDQMVRLMAGTEKTP